MLHVKRLACLSLALVIIGMVIVTEPAYETVFQAQEAAMQSLADNGKLYAEIAKSIGLEPQ